MRHLLSLLATLALVSCDKAPAKTPLQLRDEIHAAAKAAKESVEKCDGPAAEAAAVAATEALAALRKIHAQAVPVGSTPPDAALLAECEAEARNVGQWASLTQEKVARTEKLAGWKAQTYYAVQSATYKVFFHGLALAADQAAAGRLELLPQSAQDGVKEAAKFIESYVGPQRQASGDLDWNGVSRELTKLAAAPPVDLHLLLVFVTLLAADVDSAFYEIEAIPAAQIKTPQERVSYHLMRGIAYLGQSYGQLAMIEFEEANRLSADPVLKVDPASRCGIHLLLMCYFLHEKRWTDADHSLAAANRAWPDNPMMVYLTGERQIAAGNYTAAEASFAQAAKGTSCEWLAEKVAKRAKLLRDNPASLEPVVFDFNLMGELAWAFVEGQSGKSATLKSLQDQMKTARSFVEEIKQKMPAMEMKMPEAKDLWKWGADSPDSQK